MTRLKKVTTITLSLAVMLTVGVLFTNSASAKKVKKQDTSYCYPEHTCETPEEEPNSVPIADAGEDQNLVDADNDGFAAVTLDGSGSIDLDGSITSHVWFSDSLLSDFDADVSDPTTESVESEFGDIEILSTEPVATIDLPVGNHTIGLTVTDDDGAASTDYVTITIEAGDSGNEGDDEDNGDENPAEIQLDTSLNKHKGKISVSLNWSPITSSEVDVYRDGSVIATTDNDGAYTDNTGQKGKVSFTYKVCEAGTQVCSGESIASNR